MIPLLHDSDGDTGLVAGGWTVGARTGRPASRATETTFDPDPAGATGDLTADLWNATTGRYPTEQRRVVLRAAASDETVWKGLDSGSSNLGQRVFDVISDVTGDYS